MTSEKWHVTTSGPIEVRRDAFDETGRAYLIAVPSAGQRASTDDWTDRVEYVARLIAAAPELVDALEAHLELLSARIGVGRSSLQERILYRDTWPLLARVRGEEGLQ